MVFPVKAESRGKTVLRLAIFKGLSTASTAIARVIVACRLCARGGSQKIIVTDYLFRKVVRELRTDIINGV